MQISIIQNNILNKLIIVIVINRNHSHNHNYNQQIIQMDDE